VHYWYTGTIYGVTKEATKAMVGWTGLLKMTWKALGNGSFHYRYPFFLMGKYEGVNYWHGMGKKVADESDISPEVLAYVNETQPGFLENPAPWVQRIDSYLDYKNHREPVKE